MSNLLQKAGGVSERPDRRVAAIRVFPDFLVQLFTLGFDSGKNNWHTRCVEGLPPGAEFLGYMATLDSFGGVHVTQEDERLKEASPITWLLFQHESFAPVPYGEQPPELRVLFENYTLPAPDPGEGKRDD